MLGIQARGNKERLNGSVGGGWDPFQIHLARGTPSNLHKPSSHTGFNGLRK